MRRNPINYGDIVVEPNTSTAIDNWRETKLARLGRVERGRSRHRPRHAPELYGGPYPFIQTGDVKASGGRITSHTQTYSEMGLAQSRLWPVNTLAITIAANIAETAILTYPACFPDSVVGFVADESKCDVRFIEYVFRHLRSQIQHEHVGTGSVQDNINLQTLDELRFLAPPLPEQKSIAHVLGTLDDKIELNQRMNRTLEEMAQAIFQDWFVDFGPTRAKLDGQESYLPLELWNLFPDELVDSELGEIPKGWDVVRIEDVSERVAMGPFGSSIKVSTFVDSGVPIISGQHLNGMLLEDGNYRFITEDHADKLARSNVQHGDIVFTHAGNIGQAAYISSTSQYDRYVISQRQFYMRCDTSKISPLFLVHFFKTQEGQHQLLANTSSTGVPSIARPVTYLRSIMLCLPPKDLWIVWDKAAGGFYRAVARNNREIATLATQRDALLPKLVSGEVTAIPLG